MMGIYRIGWDEVMQMVVALAERLQGEHLFGIARGGLLVATILSYHGCRFSTDPRRADVIVDDIADTGHTLAAYDGETAALVIRVGCKPIPNYWVMMLSTKDYVLFPWEDEKEAFEYMRRKENDSG